MDRKDYEVRCAEENGAVAIRTAKEALERALRELNDYESRYHEATTLKDKADVTNWTINFVATSITPNMRIDLLASAQAGLLAASKL